MSPDQEKEVYSTPMPIEEPNVFTLTLRTDILNAKIDKMIPFLERIANSLNRMEDEIYYIKHGLKTGIWVEK